MTDLELVVGLRQLANRWRSHDRPTKPLGQVNDLLATAVLIERNAAKDNER